MQMAKLNFVKNPFMRPLVIFFLLLFIAVATSAQTTLQVRYHQGNRVEGVAMADAGNGDIVLVGNIYDENLSSDLLVYKVNAIGAIVWQHRLDRADGNEYARDILRLPNGHFLIGGEAYNPGASTGDILLLEVDANGFPQWAKTYGGPGSDLLSQLIPGKQGRFLLAGATNSYGAGHYDAYAIEINPGGTISWSRTFGGADEERCFAADTTQQGYILAGINNSHGNTQFAHAIHIDADGNLLWERVYGSPTNDWLFGVDYRDDQQITFLGYSSSFGIGALDNYVFTTDLSGNVLWQKAYGTIHIDFILTAASTSDGGYVTSGGEDFFSTKIDSEGNLVWHDQYRISPQNSPFRDLPADIKELSNGMIAIYGKTRILEDNSTQAYLVKVPADGFLACAGGHGHTGVYEAPANAIVGDFQSNTSSGVNVETATMSYSDAFLSPFFVCSITNTQSPPSALEAQLYPHSSGFYLEIDQQDLPLHLALYDASGRLVWQGKQTDVRFLYDFAILPGGWYALRLASSDGRTGALTWLK